MSTDKITNDLIKEALNDPNFSFMETFADASEPDKLKKENTRLLFLHRKTRNQLTIKEREKVVASSKLDKMKRDSYMKHINAQNEKVRNILVEIDVEEQKYKVEILEQQVKELNREMSSIKLELETLKAITYNLRTEMGAY